MEKLVLAQARFTFCCQRAIHGLDIGTIQSNKIYLANSTKICLLGWGSRECGEQNQAVDSQQYLKNLNNCLHLFKNKTDYPFA